MADKMARERAMQKVRKLLALAGDGRGNVQEAETAARQAAALMEKYNIEAAEAQLADLCGDEPDLVQEIYTADYDPGARKLPKDIPAWVGFLAIGVGWLCQVKVDGSYDYTTGAKSIRFSGYSTDVAFAKWLLPMLCRAVFNEARAQWGHGTRADREIFRRRAAGELQRRLKRLREEQQTAAVATAGTALVVVDKKLALIKERFGEQGSRRVSYTGSGSRSAGEDGAAYGRSAPIPGRPLGGQTTRVAIR